MSDSKGFHDYLLAVPSPFEGYQYWISRLHTGPEVATVTTSPEFVSEACLSSRFMSRRTRYSQLRSSGILDGGDDGDDEDEPSDDDEYDEDDIEANDEEDEEHLTPADSIVVALPAIDQAPSAEETEPFETDESAATPPPHLDIALQLGFLSAPNAPSSGTPPMHLLYTDRRADRPEVTLPPRKRLGIALGPRYEVRESSSAAAARPAGGLRADYGFVATMDREIKCDLERDVGYGITDYWDKIVETMQGAQLARGRMFESLEDGSMEWSDLARAEVMSLRTTVLAQQSEIRELQSADHRRQTVITEMLAADHKRQVQLTKALKLVKRLQTQMEELQRQQGPAKGPAQPELPEEAGSSS
ncbi:hypothetical protein Tco_0017141 [Tanacetum coccineum]